MARDIPLAKSPEALTYEDLRCHYFTGRSYIKSGTGRDAVRGYRSGMMTNIGDIEESEWVRLVSELIMRTGEEKIQEQLRIWARENCPWLHTKKEVELYALELHAARIFENPLWAEYDRFSKILK